MKFEDEVAQNLSGNEKYWPNIAKQWKLDEGKGYRQTVDEALANYTREHQALSIPPENEAMWNANQAAIGIGEGDWNKARAHLRMLQRELDKGVESWVDYVNRSAEAQINKAIKGE